MAPAPPTSTISNTAAVVTQIYYPPAASHFALSVPTIIGIVIAGVGFLVLCAVIAAFTVCFLDRKKESKAEKEERKREKADGKSQIENATENSSIAGEAQEEHEAEDMNVNGNENGGADIGESVIGPRYASMIGVDTSTNNTPKAKGKQKEKERMIVHLPVHVADLGTPRQSQIHYEREDPGDEERDERGFRRGASWWHPEL